MVKEGYLLCNLFLTPICIGTQYVVSILHTNGRLNFFFPLALWHSPFTPCSSCTTFTYWAYRYSSPILTHITPLTLSFIHLPSLRPAIIKLPLVSWTFWIPSHRLSISFSFLFKFCDAYPVHFIYRGFRGRTHLAFSRRSYPLIILRSLSRVYLQLPLSSK